LCSENGDSSLTPETFLKVGGRKRIVFFPGKNNCARKEVGKKRKIVTLLQKCLFSGAASPGWTSYCFHRYDLMGISPHELLYHVEAVKNSRGYPEKQ
jgi:hypothetical protein